MSLEPPFSLKRPKVKPVHLATGVFVTLLGGFRRLERLNRVAMHQPKIMKSGQHKGRVHPDDPYAADRIYDELRRAGRISDRVDRQGLDVVRQSVHQLLNNDQAAFHCYTPHRPFGNDYTTSQGKLVTMDPNHPTDGDLGAIIVATLRETPEGQTILRFINDILAAPTTLGALAQPFTDDDDLAPRTRVVDAPAGLATLMAAQTNALGNLVSRLQGNFTVETQARLIIIGLCLWVLECVLLWSGRAIAAQNQRLVLADFTQHPRRPMRRASWMSIVQARRQLNDYRQLCKEANPPVNNPGPWAELFDYLGKRCGLIQPRSDTSRARKYVEPMPDTIRVLVMSSFKPTERLLPFGELAKRLRETWSLILGADKDDLDRIRQTGLGIVTEDQDLALNVRCFRERLEELQLAVRLSDGEHRCAALPEDLP